MTSFQKFTVLYALDLYELDIKKQRRAHSFINEGNTYFERELESIREAKAAVEALEVNYEQPQE